MNRPTENRAISEQISFGEQMTAFLRGHANLLLAAAIALLLLQDVFGIHGLLAMRHSQQQATQVQKQIDQLNQENRQLLEQVKSLKRDPSAIERIAREEMGLARPGEMIFKTGPSALANGAAANNPTNSSQKP